MSENKPRKRSLDAKTVRKPGGSTKAAEGFSVEERNAMRERAGELKPGKLDGEGEVLAKIAAMPEPDRTMAGRLHVIIKTGAPALSPRTWYGMPAYAIDGNVVCFFQSSQKFKTRYSTLGFSDKAKLDNGPMWPTAYALKELGPKEESRIVELVKKAVG